MAGPPSGGLSSPRSFRQNQQGSAEGPLTCTSDTSSALLHPRSKEAASPDYWSTQASPWADMLNPLKDELDGDEIVSGCGELARNLLSEDLVDEVRLWVHPVVWGDGERPVQGEKVRVRLVESKEFDSGVTLLRYQPLAVG
jgi:dihydrofolate reductase